MTAPLASIIMPAHNASATISEAVHSVLHQSIKNLELIVCDDASTDSTPHLIDKITDPRVRPIHNPTNLGPGSSRDRAIEAASAPWIAFIDADDAWQPQRLEKLLAAIEDSDAAIFDDIMTCHDANGHLIPWQPIHGTRAFRGSGKLARHIQIEDYITSPRLLIKPLISTAFIRKHHIRHSNRRFGEDAEFFLRLAAAGARFRYLPEPLYLYRVQPGSATSQASISQMRECIQDCENITDWSDSVKDAFQRKIRTLRHNETLYRFAAHLKAGQPASAIRDLAADPAALAILPGRSRRYMAYHAHRILHGGASRTTQGE